MSKIVNFSSIHRGIFIDTRINKIKKELKNEKISTRKLHHLQGELNDLGLFLTKQLNERAALTQHTMGVFLLQQTELSCLMYTCQNVFIDKRIDKLTQNAQKIAKESQDPYKNVSQKIAKLKKSIHSLTYQEALSLENRQMINLAKAYLNDAKEHIYTHDLSRDTQTIRIDFKKENSQRDLMDFYETSLALYEIAGAFYHHDLKEAFSLFYSLSPSLQKEVKEEVLKVGGSFDRMKELKHLDLWKDNLYLVIQALIGYSNQLIYNTTDYPTHQEIDSLFRDLDKILQENVSANF